jgi:hypothetical protein
MPGSGEGQRKRSVTATAPLAYLTVDRAALRSLARPWPVAEGAAP